MKQSYSACVFVLCVVSTKKFGRKKVEKGVVNGEEGGREEGTLIFVPPLVGNAVHAPVRIRNANMVVGGSVGGR